MVIDEKSGKVKISRRMPYWRRPAFITNLPFVPSSFSLLVELFTKGVKNMEELDKSFKEAFHLATICKPISNNGRINWDEIAIKYKRSIVPNKIAEYNWQNNERSRIERACAILNADRNDVLRVKECMERYSTLHLEKLTLGGTGRKRNLLDVARFLDFAFDNCGVYPTWKPLTGGDLTDLIGKITESVKPKTPLKPDEPFNIIDSLFDKLQFKL